MLQGIKETAELVRTLKQAMGETEAAVRESVAAVDAKLAEARS